MMDKAIRRWVRSAPIMTVLCGLAMMAWLCWASSVDAGELTVAAAADLNYAFKDLVTEFEHQTGERVKLSLGSSGNFYSQIANGAPFDLYFSADIGYPKKLIQEGLAVPNSLYQYATGRIVLWVPKGSKLDVAKGMDVLLDPSIKKIAIANPKHAPYGRAAVAAMEYFKVYDRVKDKLALGENVSQAAQFAQSGAADIGIIALSLASAPPVQAVGTYWLIPQEAHPRIDQGAAIVRSSKNQEAARKFLDFLQTPAARAVMKRYGFLLPGEDGASP
ncbi:MAG TPA: molybdate ABC transporter substrate-binding protein [Nitrospiraceae bacterium]|nr:molybdate ABC transporter substrate-binding protein [Nitrospiraceae bacterium]